MHADRPARNLGCTGHLGQANLFETTFEGDIMLPSSATSPPTTKGNVLVRRLPLADDRPTSLPLMNNRTLFPSYTPAT